MQVEIERLRKYINLNSIKKKNLVREKKNWIHIYSKDVYNLFLTLHMLLNFGAVPQILRAKHSNWEEYQPRKLSQMFSRAKTRDAI